MKRRKRNLGLDAAWRQQQTLVQEIIALRKGLLEDAKSHSDEEREQPEPNTIPAVRLAELSAELDVLHHTQQLVSPHVDKKQIAAVIAEWTGVPLNRLSQNEMSVITELPQWLGRPSRARSWPLNICINTCSRHALICAAQGARSVRFCWPGQAV
jgi:ATP-dependent Clp protease ATP-binding subunit ClpA